MEAFPMNEAEVTASERPTSKRPPKKSYPAKSSKSQPNPDLKAQVPFPGIESVMHGNGAVAHVMEHVCDGVIGYPITPSTEISEIYEAYRASGGINVWERRPFFFEPEGEHSAQSGAMGAALTGGKYISNASSSQGILYGLESHFVTAGKKIGGFVLQIAARVVSRNSLNVMAGHDDVYALLPSGYTIFFGSNPQEAADLAAIAYRSSSLSLIPAANAMDGFSTSHMQSEVLLPEPELLKRYLGDPSERIPCPSVAQEILFGARGRYWQLNHFLEHHSLEFDPEAFDNLKDFLKKNENQLDQDSAESLLQESLQWVPLEIQGSWKRQWVHSHRKGSRQRVPALVDPHSPGLTGGVQNQPDFQAGIADHLSHFASEVPRFVVQAMEEYTTLTGREYHPVQTVWTEDADWILLGMGSVTDDAEAVASHLRNQGKRVGVVSVKLLHPFPEADVIRALQGKKAVTVMERSGTTALTQLVNQALYRSFENHRTERHPGIPGLNELPSVSTAIFGLGGHDLQPRHLVAAFENMISARNVPLYYLGSKFFSDSTSPEMNALQEQLKKAYPETVSMALETGENPKLLPKEAIRVRFHSVGGYGTIASGKLLTDILAAVLGLHSKSAPKYGSEKSGAPTNFYLTLSPEPIKITNAQLEEVEIVISPDHKVFEHTNPLNGLVEGGTFIMQSGQNPREVWQELPEHARETLRERNIHFLIVDAFGVARRHAPSPDLQVRMMGVVFIGALCAHDERIRQGTSGEDLLEKIQQQVNKKFGAKGPEVVRSNMLVLKEGMESTQEVDYRLPEFTEIIPSEEETEEIGLELSAEMGIHGHSADYAGLGDTGYFNATVAQPFKDGSIDESPVLPGIGLFMPSGSASWKDKGLFRLSVPEFQPELCTGCLECTLVCPDAAIPNTLHEIQDLLNTSLETLKLSQRQREHLQRFLLPLVQGIREELRNSESNTSFAEVAAKALDQMEDLKPQFRKQLSEMLIRLSSFPLARTRTFYEASEQKNPGSGVMYSVVIDPWKCTGCLECVDVCGPGALVEQPEEHGRLLEMRRNFRFLSRLPESPPRFLKEALKSGGDSKRLMLDRENYYAMTGGHGACRGCGEVTAIRLITSANRAMRHQRYLEHARELESLTEKLRHKMGELVASKDQESRLERVKRTLMVLDRRLYHFESGPTGHGPASSVFANATGCSSVYGSTFPFNPYTDPWVNSLFQDSAPLAKGIFEGLSATNTEEIKALRIAELELHDGYDEAVHDDYFKYFNWSDFTGEELALQPAVIDLGGDGATYDIGFGALSRLLSTNTPVKVVVLNSGTYSNTGGQASTASYTAQDSDLSRYGRAQTGKQETRKELGLIAAFHPKVLVMQTTAGLMGHFLRCVNLMLGTESYPALMDVYTPCQAEHGIADAAASRQARLAVESRMNPVFVHNPDGGESLADRFSLEGNPDPKEDWTKIKIEYLDQEEKSALKEIPLTPADFAATEGRFRKHFQRASTEEALIPVAEYLQMDSIERKSHKPFIWSVDEDKHLIRLLVSQSVIGLAEERLRNWRMLRFLNGQPVQEMEKHHRDELQQWKQRYQDLIGRHEQDLDSIAKGMSELASSSRMPASFGMTEGLMKSTALIPQTEQEVAQEFVSSTPMVSISEEDLPLCSNCKSCYQDAGELFEATTILVDGSSKEVARVIPGVLENLEMTPELVAKAERAAADCDSEIIHFQSPH